MRTITLGLLIGLLAIVTVTGCGTSERDKGKNSGKDQPVPSATR